MSQHHRQSCAICGQPTRRSVRQSDGTRKFVCGRPHESQAGQMQAVVETAPVARFSRTDLFQQPPKSFNLVTGTRRPMPPVPPPTPTPAEHVLLAQAAVRKSRTRKRDAIGRSWNALGVWLEQPWVPPVKPKRAQRFWPRWMAARAKYALPLVAVLPLLAVEVGVWRVGA